MPGLAVGLLLPKPRANSSPGGAAAEVDLSPALLVGNRAACQETSPICASLSPKFSSNSSSPYLTEMKWIHFSYVKKSLRAAWPSFTSELLPPLQFYSPFCYQVRNDHPRFLPSGFKPRAMGFAWVQSTRLLKSSSSNVAHIFFSPFL